MNLQAFHKLSYGMYIISSRQGDKFNGQIANAVAQITAEPALVAVSINKQNLTHRFIMESKVFSISVLSRETPGPFLGLFGFKSGRDVDKFAEVSYMTGTTGVPIITQHTLAYFELKVCDAIDAATHTLFIGRVEAAEIIGEGEPMTYAYYHQVRRGQVPKNAPTYIGKEATTLADGKYKCSVCGYVYDPAEGDPDNDIKPGTSFEELPEDWVCPLCGAPKSEFEKV